MGDTKGDTINVLDFQLLNIIKSHLKLVDFEVERLVETSPDRFFLSLLNLKIMKD
jgi:hypothetical protein